MGKIKLKYISPWEREEYPELKSKTELKKMKLMPAYNVKPRALVVRKKYDDYYLYDVNKTIPYHESKKEKARKKAEQKRRDRECTCKKCGTKFDYKDIKYDAIPFLKQERLCATCYYKQYQKYQKGIVYDLETTGLYPWDDEILSMCIVDLQGNILFNHYFKPERHEFWESALEVNGITPEMVVNEKPFSYYKEEIQKIFDSADILITYNGMDFDDNFLSSENIIIPDVKKFDVMLEFAWLMHEWNYKHKNWYWHKLTDCAASYGYTFQAHDATQDVLATLFCYKKIIGL